MIDVQDVGAVRSAESQLMAELPEGALMQRAATGLAITCVNLLRAVRGSVTGARIVLMVGSGNNGGDALWAGAMLAGRGCRVDAITLGERVHPDGLAALRRAGGRVHAWSADDAAIEAVVGHGDVVLDGILGIGGSGGLRADAVALVDLVNAGDAIVVAVDLPSGVDADTGAVNGAAVDADLTVTFGSTKPGLVVAPGLLHAGGVHLIDIGLRFDHAPLARIMEPLDVAAWVAEPGPDSYKYRRGVVAVAAGSGTYPGAALLTVSAARHGNVGMARYLDRADGVAASVVSHYPDVVVDGSDPADQERADAWACGPGFPGEPHDEPTVLAVLAVRRPVVLDAGALTVVAESAAVRERLHERSEQGFITVLTPHAGEFERMLPGVLESAGGRIAAAQEGAAALASTVVLKGPGTVIAGSAGPVFIDTVGTSDLGTAGSGDVLTGLVAALLAGAWAAGLRDADELCASVAAAVWVHGMAGRIAGEHAPATATDIAAAVPAAIRRARFGEQPC